MVILIIRKKTPLLVKILNFFFKKLNKYQNPEKKSLCNLIEK